MKIVAGWQPITRGIIIAAAIAVVVMSLRTAASIISPLLLAVFIAVVATPPLRWMLRKGVPKYLALFIVIIVLLDLGSLIALVATGALEGLRGSLPTYQERFILLSDQFGGWLESIGLTHSRKALPDLINPAAATRLVHATLSNLSSTFATGLLVLLAVIFMLLEAPQLRPKLRRAFQLTEEAELRLEQLIDATNYYMMVKCLTSLATGLSIWAWLWYLGIDFAILWGVLAFFLNFVPFIGAILMTVPAVLVALVQVDLPTALLVALGYLVSNGVIGSIIEPRIMGRGLGISETALFAFLLFWGWVFGTIGVFLSVPLTMALIIALDASPQTRPFAIILRTEVGQSGKNEATPQKGDAAQT